MLAKRIYGGDCAFFIEATPTTERTTPAPKLAQAEKHISSELKLKRGESHPFPSVGFLMT